MNEWSNQQQSSDAGSAALVPPGTEPTQAPPTQTPIANPAPVPPPNQSTMASNPPQAVQSSGSPPINEPASNREPASRTLWNQRTDGMTLVAGFHFLVAALFLLGTLIMMIPTGILGIVSVVEDPDAMIAMFIVGGIGILTLGLCLLYLAVGYGLWTLKPWGRVAALALAVVSLFGVPIGTVTGGLTLWYLMQPNVAQKFEAQAQL